MFELGLNNTEHTENRECGNINITAVSFFPVAFLLEWLSGQANGQTTTP